MGRVLAEPVPDDNPIAPVINEKRKHVVSNTLESAEWHNSTILKGDAATEVAKLKAEPGGDLIVSGSITLVRSLIAADLLDELGLMVHPLVRGRGRRLFDSVDEEKRLQLVDSRTFTTGVASLKYRPA